MASVGTYGVTNIPSIVTDAYNDIMGKSNSISAITTTNFVSCGKTIDDFDLLDGWYQSIAKRIIKTVFFAKQYNADTRRILMDEHTYGGFIQKLYTIAPEEVDSPSFKYAPDAVTRQITQVSPYDLTTALQVKSVIFGNEGTWSYEFIQPDIQLKKAWNSPAEMIAFIDSTFIAVRNRIEVAKEAVINAAINTSMARSFSNGKVINLLTEYVSATGDNTVTDLDSFLINKEAIRFANRMIKDTINLMSKPNVNFNIEGYETFTSKEDMDIDIIGLYASASAAYLESDTFHNELVKLPGYHEVTCWQTPGDGIIPDAAECTKVSITHADINSGNNVAISGAVAFIRDHENVAAYFGDEYMWSDPNVRQRISNFGFQYNKGYAVDGFTNAIVFVIAP